MPDATPDPTTPVDAPADPACPHRQWGDLWVARWWPLTIPLAFVLVFGLCVVALFAIEYRTAHVPPVGEAAIEPPTVLLGAQGEELGKLDPGQLGEEVSADDLPEHVVDAILAAEDRRFFEHQGFSTRATLRAAWANLRSGEVEQGASTITQQYVDLATPGPGNTLRAKFDEVATAARLEDELGKDEILDRYVNLVPFGRDAIGIDQAARVYFRVPATDLSVNQAATLAGMIAAPSAYDPENNPTGARQRRDGVLEAMVDEGRLATARAQQLQGSPLPEVSGESLVQFGAAAYVVDAVRRQLAEELGREGLGRGLVVRTTIDRRMQQLAQETLREHVGDQPWGGAVVSIDPATGGVRALVGGTDFADQPFNTAIQAERQPGSSFKPFTLAAFIEAGNDPSGTAYPAPATLRIDAGGENVEVSNFGNQGFGRLTVAEATVNSVNTVYMQMVEEVGAHSVVSLAHDMGIESDLPEVPSIALGTGTVTPYEMTSAYATFAAGGVHRDPSVIRSVEDVDGEVLWEFEPEDDRAIDERTAGVVSEILSQVVRRGTGVAAQIGRPVAGKTGTTDDSRDAWFAGYAPQLATVVWIGNLDNSPIPDATGGGLAAPAWSDYMVQAMEPIPVAQLPSADSDGLDELDDVDEAEGDEDAPEEDASDPAPEPTSSPSPPPEPTGSPPPAPEPSSSPPPSSPTPEPTGGSPSPSSSPTDDEGSDEDDDGLLPLFDNDE